MAPWLTHSLVSTRSSTVNWTTSQKTHSTWSETSMKYSKRLKPKLYKSLALRTLNEPPCSYNLLYSSAVQKCENSESKIIRGKFPFSKNQLFISTKDNRINLFICS